jgi:hypothetical protein
MLQNKMTIEPHQAWSVAQNIASLRCKKILHKTQRSDTEASTIDNCFSKHI